MNVLHANTTLVDRVDLATPAIAFLSTGYRPLGSCSRAAGWSAATSCIGAERAFGEAPVLASGEPCRYTLRSFINSNREGQRYSWMTLSATGDMAA